MTQLGLFSENTPEHSAYLGIKKKRVHYKNTTYTKFYKNDVIQGNDIKVKNDNATWGKMNQLYQILANYFPYPLFQGNKQYSDTNFIDNGIIRTYKTQYKKENYLYRGDDGITRLYKGQDFEVREAEIIGTEDLGINERLFLHETLIEYLDMGYKIEQLSMWIEEMINWFLQGVTVEQFILFLLILNGINARF